MPHDPTLNPTDILTALGITTVTAIAPVHGGTDTALWRVEHGSMTSVLRVFRSEQAETHQREIEAMEVARQAHVPVPTIRAAGVWQEQCNCRLQIAFGLCQCDRCATDALKARLELH